MKPIINFLKNSKAEFDDFFPFLTIFDIRPSLTLKASKSANSAQKLYQKVPKEHG